MNPRYLTKSRFQLAMDCPTKLYYNNKPEYANQKIEDPFLLALAEGGFQVGALAKCYFPGGYEVEIKDYEEALKRTNELLEQENVIIYEAAVRFDNLFIRTDILIKEKNHLDLIEVKAKSFDFLVDDFYNKSGGIASGWQSYLCDVAFQKHVMSMAFPNYEISAFLMMADKTALCPTDGLNQKFKIEKDSNGLKHVSVSSSLVPADLIPPVLIKINVDDCCDEIYNTEFEIESEQFGFKDCVKKFSSCYEKDAKIITPISGNCGGCEYRTTEEEAQEGLESGFQECWKEQLVWTDDDLKDATVLDIWNFRKKNQFICERRIKLTDIDEEDIGVKQDGKPGVSLTERQWLQISKVQNADESYWIDAENLKREMDGWVYPLHFIDFETSMAAIPFNKGRHPYEGIGFQFSHHIVKGDGTIEHAGQYLNTSPGFFPNYEFIRKLKSELEKDEGSVFRYATHENTYLNIIYKQLMGDPNDIPDRDELCLFIKSITKSVNGSVEKWEGPRRMIDMCELVKRYYYDPATGGSNSIKYVLPAILNSSSFLKAKYSQPIYGAEGCIPSLNYKDWKWIEYEDGIVVDPYKLLPKMFQNITDKDFELLNDTDDIRNGGAALTAYAKMQFEEMSDYERKEIEKALLKYCELDTFAMVMIYEGWKDLIQNELG